MLGSILITFSSRVYLFCLLDESSFWFMLGRENTIQPPAEVTSGPCSFSWSWWWSSPPHDSPGHYSEWFLSPNHLLLNELKTLISVTSANLTLRASIILIVRLSKVFGGFKLFCWLKFLLPVDLWSMPAFAFCAIVNFTGLFLLELGNNPRFQLNFVVERLKDFFECILFNREVFVSWGSCKV